MMRTTPSTASRRRLRALVATLLTVALALAVTACSRGLSSAPTPTTTSALGSATDGHASARPVKSAGTSSPRIGAPSSSTAPSARIGGPSVGPTSASSSPPAAADFRAPQLAGPLVQLDPGLAQRGPRPTLAELAQVQSGDPSAMFAARATPGDWRLSNPSQIGVEGYASDVSVVPGGVIDLHLSGIDRAAQLDVFRMGLRDAEHLLTVPDVPVSFRVHATPRLSDGLVEDRWPVSYRLAIPSTWRSGVYLVKLSGTSGRQSYITFVVRATAPQALMVVLPTMTYQAYNDEGGSDLYGWNGGPRDRAYVVSFDRPYNHEFGAGLFFRLDFPFVVWLEDHGYTPGYITDLDLARDPSLVNGTRTLVFSGHSEYWTGGMRDTLDAASQNGLNLAVFGANEAFWQVRLQAEGAAVPNREVVCYKDPAIDPITFADSRSATGRFEQPPVNRPPRELLGLEYGGIVVGGLQPMVIGAGISQFAPDIGLRPGDRLPGLIGGELDSPPPGFIGVLLGASVVRRTEGPQLVTSAAALWVNRAGGRAFDAGTFDFSWGLDPRYAAALPGFPADAFSRLTADILAWLGAQPSV